MTIKKNFAFFDKFNLLQSLTELFELEEFDNMKKVTFAEPAAK